MIMINLKI